MSDPVDTSEPKGICGRCGCEVPPGDAICQKCYDEYIEEMYAQAADEIMRSEAEGYRRWEAEEERNEEIRREIFGDCY